MSYSNTIARAWTENRLMSVLLELTYACNLDCTFCYNDLTIGGQRLSLKQYRERCSTTWPRLACSTSR